MLCGHDKVSDLHIAYIGGGSRAWAWNLMGDLALELRLSGKVCLYDIDYPAAKANEMIGNKLPESLNCAGKWMYEAKTSIQEALVGADFVVISILPGTFNEMESDVHAPEKYGIYQSVGDTVGSGGILRAMRTVPMYVEIAEAIAQHCPRAWVINYTNPMSVCTSTLYHVFPKITAFGCCHEVFSTQRLFARLLETECGIPNVSRDEIRLNVMGVNHFTWIDQASWKQTDLIPLFAQSADKYAESGYAVTPAELDSQNTFRNVNKVSFDLFRRYHIAPAAGDRHIAEFVPPWYLKGEKEVLSWGIALTPVSYRRENKRRQIKLSEQVMSGKADFPYKLSGEEGVRQMKALLGFSDFVTNVNLPNEGQMKGLPMRAVVETNAHITRDSIMPVLAGQLPGEVGAITLRHAINQEMLVVAGIAKDIEMAFHVFLNDPLMTLDIEPARQLFGEMVQNTRSYLQGWAVDLFPGA